MTSAIFNPFCPPIAPPTTTSMTLSRISSTPVRKIFIRVPSSNTHEQQKHFERRQRSLLGKRKRSAPNLDSCRSRGLFFLDDGELHLLSRSIAIHANALPWKNSAFQDLQGERILNHALNGATQGARAVGWIVALAENQFFRRGSQLQRDLTFGEQFLDALQQHADDPSELLLAQRVKDDNFIDAIDELRAERRTQDFHGFFTSGVRIISRPLINHGGAPAALQYT